MAGYFFAGLTLDLWMYRPSNAADSCQENVWCRKLVLNQSIQLVNCAASWTRENYGV